jgi:opacity protein-like surface antigen
MALLLFSLMSFGEDDQKVQLFGGYSFQRVSTGDVSGANLDSLLGASAGTFNVKRFLSGWNGELQYNLTSRYGLVLDASGDYGKPISGSSSSGYGKGPSAHSYWYLIGPVARFPKGKLTPFVEAMAGKNSLKSNTSEAVSFFGTAATPASDSSFGVAAGGGLDWQVKKHLAVRLGQLDYLYSRHNAANYASSVFGTSTLSGTANFQNSLRFSAGLIYHFGNW